LGIRLFARYISEVLVMMTMMMMITVRLRVKCL
jgi:hypothetical protein